MASFTMLDVAVLVGGHDFSTDSNQVSLSVEVEDLDVTTFQGGGYRTRIGGLKDISCEVSGFQDDGAVVDSEAIANLGVRDVPVTLSPTATAGDTAYMFKAGQFSYESFGSVGEASPFSLSFQGTGGREGAVRGMLSAYNHTPVASTGFGDLEFSAAPASGQFVYAVVHVLEADTTMTLTVESAADSDFTDPETQFTFPAITATGGYWMTRIAGPLADQTFWRFNATTVTGPFNVACAIGVQ